MERAVNTVSKINTVILRLSLQAIDFTIIIIFFKNRSYSRIYGIKAMSKFANTSNRGQVCLYYQNKMTIP